MSVLVNIFRSLILNFKNTYPSFCLWTPLHSLWVHVNILFPCLVGRIYAGRVLLQYSQQRTMNYIGDSCLLTKFKVKDSANEWWKPANTSFQFCFNGHFMGERGLLVPIGFPPSPFLVENLEISGTCYLLARCLSSYPTNIADSPFTKRKSYLKLYSCRAELVVSAY